MKKTIAKGITINPEVKFGKPFIEGTRIPVDLIVGKIAGGMEIKDIMKEYDLTKRQILNALQYAADLVKQEEVIFA